MQPDNYFSKHDLEKILQDKIKPEEIGRIIAAYEIAESSLSDKFDPNGQPKFFHSTRLSKILLDELKISEPDIIISSLLHNILINTDDISISLIDYNFGSTVAYYVQILSDDYLILTRQKKEHLNLDFVDDDVLILMLTDCLDVIRSYDFQNFLNPFAYLDDIKNRYFEIAKKRDNEKIHYLLKEMIISFNKLIG
jgi:(p)ppGpp synthase/HD superfamily hydrolase